MENEEVAKILEATKPQDVDLKLMKTYMRIDFDDEENDNFIEVLLMAAKSFVQSYLNWKFNDYEGDIPSEITVAVMTITEHWYKNRGVLNEDTSRQELPFVFSGILDIHRNWNVASTGVAL